jgi:hypothetical protein
MGLKLTWTDQKNEQTIRQSEQNTSPFIPNQTIISCSSHSYSYPSQGMCFQGNPSLSFASSQSSPQQVKDDSTQRTNLFISSGKLHEIVFLSKS